MCDQGRILAQKVSSLAYNTCFISSNSNWATRATRNKSLLKDALILTTLEVPSRPSFHQSWIPMLTDAPLQLTLFQPDGTTEIDPAETIAKLNEFKVGPWKPMVVTVEERPTPAPTGSSKKQLTYKGMSSEASCIKLLDALAVELYCFYDFRIAHKKPTMGDVLAAKDAQQGKPSQPLDEKGRPIFWWDYQTKDGIQVTTTPLGSFYSPQQWDLLRSFNQDTNNRIHNAQLPRTRTQKPFVILPHETFTANEFVDTLSDIAVVAGLIFAKDDLIVKDESDL